MNSKAIVALLTVVACCWAVPLETSTAPPSSNATTTLKPDNSSTPLLSDPLPNAENGTAGNSSSLDPKIIEALMGGPGEMPTDEKVLARIIECGLLDDPNYKKNETKTVRSAEVLTACGNLTLSNMTMSNVTTPVPSHNATGGSTEKPANATAHPSDKPGSTPAPKKDSKEDVTKKPEPTKKPSRRDAAPKVEGNSTLPAHNKTEDHMAHANGTACDEHGHPLVKGDLKGEGNSTAKNETMKAEHNNGTTTTTEKPAVRRRRDSYGSQVRVAVRHQPKYAAAAPARSSSYESVRTPARYGKAVVREESYAPAAREESYSAPAVREESYSAPAVREESYSAPAVREESYSAPAVREESYSAPVVVRQKSYAPAVREESYSAPAVREESYDPAVVIRESSSYEAPSAPVKTESYSSRRFAVPVRSSGY